MVIFINANGVISTVIPAIVTQGSNNVQDITLIAGGVSQFSAVSINFTLPNGQKINGGIMTPTDVTIQDQLFNAYNYRLDKNLTNFPGVVTVGFNIHDSNNAILKTYLSKFTVNKTNKPMLPEIPDVDVYEQILSSYAYLLGIIENSQLSAKSILPYDENYAYQNNELTYSTVDGETIEFYRSKIDDNLGNELNDNNFWQKCII